MSRTLLFAGFLLSSPAFLGCGGLEQFPRGKATGRVVCEGKPVVRAMVYFEPKRGNDSALVGQQGYALTDDEGRFTISTYGENDGAVVGRHLIRVGKSETVAPCNCALNAMKVQKEVDVTAAGPNDFEIVLEKKSLNNKDEFTEKE